MLKKHVYLKNTEKIQVNCRWWNNCKILLSKGDQKTTVYNSYILD